MSLTRLLRCLVFAGVLAAGVLALSSGLPGSVLAEGDLDALVGAFWAAATDEERLAARNAILSADSRYEFSSVAEAMRHGRRYSADVGRGRQLLTRRNRDGVEFPYLVHVPESYDPSRPYPVRVYLHGGIMRPKRDDGSWWRNPDRFVRDDTIVVFPTSWPESIWWQRSQVENLAGLLNDIKRQYHIDENRLFLLGVSDGATGAYYHAFKATTPWAGFLPFIGHPAVLGNPSSGVGGEMHVVNLTGKPFFIVNGGRDRLYPVASVEPYLDLFERAGVAMDFRPQPEGGHNLDWWPELTDAIDEFVADTRREPLPDRLSWRDGRHRRLQPHALARHQRTRRVGRRTVCRESAGIGPHKFAPTTYAGDVAGAEHNRRAGGWRWAPTDGRGRRIGLCAGGCRSRRRSRVGEWPRHELGR